MEDVDFWRLCDELTVYQAAHLLIGVMPGEVEAMEAMGSDLVPRDRARYTKNLAAAQAAIANGLKNYKKYCEACEEANRAMAAAHYEPGAYDEHDEHGLALMLRRSIVGELIPLYETDINGNQAWPMPGTIDCDKSTVDVDSFKRWLKSRGFTTGFFFPEGSDDSPDYLDPRTPALCPQAGRCCMRMAGGD
jgi:cytochrome c5